jgi:hypothetical protein
MKMGTTASPWRYDVASRSTLAPPSVRLADSRCARFFETSGAQFWSLTSATKVNHVKFPVRNHVRDRVGWVAPVSTVDGMPINQLLKGSNFRADEIEILDLAFERFLHSLGPADRSDLITELVATWTIAIGQTGSISATSR